MTTQEFLQKFPEVKKINSNVLQNIACPECGSRSEFAIEYNSIGVFGDDGCADGGDNEFAKNNYCRCEECDHEGEIHKFTFPGLDDSLRDELP